MRGLLSDCYSILKFYVTDADVWRGCGCCLVLVALLVGSATCAARADDKSDADVKAKLALAVAVEQNRCVCADGKTRSWKDAVVLSKRTGMPIVVFAGDESPRCCGDAIPVRMTLAEASANKEYPIIVYVPNKDGKTMDVVQTLKPGADRDAIRGAVNKAKKWNE